MKKFLFSRLILLILFPCLADAQSMKAGVGKKIITPQLPYLLTGYAVRTQPAIQKVHDLWAKALVIQSHAGDKIVIVTTDVLGLTPEIHQEVVKQLSQKFGFKEKQILLNSSHTHSGPMVWPSLEMIADYDHETVKKFRAYKDFLINRIIGAVDMAVNNSFEAALSSGHGSAGFAMNRREWSGGKIINGKNPAGNVDHDVPVLKIENKKGEIKAVLFGYACHNTTIGGDNFLINGDYAGFAQIAVEKDFPGATALFFTGCAGDQNPQPRGTLALAEKHGETLAQSVKNVLRKPLQKVQGNIRSELTYATLEFVPFDYEKYNAALSGANIYEQRRARLMIQAYNRGWDVTKYHYPVQAIRFGKDLTFISLAGEVVVDYSLKLKEKYAKENLFVAGYCNHVMGYIPTKKVLQEGGYEANENLIYYGMLGPFAENAEAIIFNTIQKIMTRLGVK